ncbi:MAG: membrane protein insertion efficiency factor YidD [Patescibacteria group bacterium]
MTFLLIQLIRLYQRTLSPDHGWFAYRHPYGYCRFSPTCSQYAIDALTTYGLFRGILKSIWRVLRCAPWSQGGYDPARRTSLPL